jgi:hypothetical protein
MSKNLIGILVAEEGKGKVMDNIVSDSVSVGISVMSKACPEMTGNRLNGGPKSTVSASCIFQVSAGPEYD